MTFHVILCLSVLDIDVDNIKVGFGVTLIQPMLVGCCSVNHFIVHSLILETVVHDL